MASSNHANDVYLDSFLERISAKYRYISQSNLEVQEVKELVHETINNIVKKAYSPDLGWTVREIIPVGSMVEGTRITRPYEFDFMIVLAKFDADDITETVSDCEGTFVTLKTECGLENCACALKEPYDPIFANVQISDCKFAAMDKINSFNTVFLLFRAKDRMAEHCRSCSVESFTGKLQLIDIDFMEFNGPALTTKLVFKKCGGRRALKISVDLVIVTELEINEHFLDRLDIFHQHFYTKLKDTKKVHLHLSGREHEGNVAFRVSFAFTEVQLLRDESETHRKCYKLLKYIFHTKPDDFKLLSSFMLKNLVLQHVVCCEGGGLGRCLLKILGDLRDKIDGEGRELPFIRHIFNTKLSLTRPPQAAELVQNYQDSWTSLRKNVSELIENLEKFRNGSPIPSSFQFRIDNQFLPMTGNG